MRGILFRKAPEVAEFSARPHAWLQIDRKAALRWSKELDIVVVTPTLGLDYVEWLHRDHASMKGNAPYRLDLFRFYMRIQRTHFGSANGNAPVKPAQADAITDSEAEPLVEKEPVPTLLNPGFRAKDSGDGDDVREAAANSVLFLKVDSHDLSTGDSILFHLFRKGAEGKPDEKIETLSGSVRQIGDGMGAVAKWNIGSGAQGREHVKGDRIYFLARHTPKKLEAKSAVLTLTVKGRMIGFEMWCEHGKKGGDGKSFRLAKNGEILSIVPAVADPDTVTLHSVNQGKPDWVAWSGKGWKDFREDGEEIKVKIPSLEQMHLDFLPMAGIWGAKIRAQEIKVTAADEQGNRKEAVIRVYPNHQSKVDWDLSKDFGAFGKLKEMAEKIASNLKRIPFLPAKLEIEAMKGKVSLSNEFKEDTKSRNVFVCIDLNASFSPLIAGKLKWPIPIKGLADMIPPELLDYLANIEAYGEIYGKIDLKIAAGRFKYNDFNVDGGVKGAVGLSLNMKVRIGGGKLLRIDAKAGTEISLGMNLWAEGTASENEFAIHSQAKCMFEGLAGSLSWVVMDGKWTRQNQWKFVNSRELYVGSKSKLYP